MVTFNDPIADADEAQQALRGLAHATRHINDADSMYQVLGSLSAALWAAQQSLDQLAAWHERNRRLATDHDDTQAGPRTARRAADHLRFAAVIAARSAAHVDEAWNLNGRLTWQPPAAQQHRPTPAPTTEHGSPAASRHDGMSR